jgi:hypothetical protein
MLVETAMTKVQHSSFRRPDNTRSGTWLRQMMSERMRHRLNVSNEILFKVPGWN